jgi:hypothetical protein
VREGLSRGLLNTICTFVGLMLIVYEAGFRAEPRPVLVAAYMALVAGPVGIEALRRAGSGGGSASSKKNDSSGGTP